MLQYADMNTKKKKFVIGNWKMAPLSPVEAKNIFGKIKKVAGKLRNVQTVICPPVVYLEGLHKMVSGHRCVVGAQSAFWEVVGAYTGQVSPTQLRSVGADYVIVGHSERRAMGITDELVAQKIKLFHKNKLIPVLCVGEDDRDDNGDYIRFIKGQLLGSLDGISKKIFDDMIIAYEPVWAIGKDAKREASSDDVAEIVMYLRKILVTKYGKAAAMRVPILYGGSVNIQNAHNFLENGGVDGFLVGRASRDPKAFEKILKIADTFTSKI